MKRKEILQAFLKLLGAEGIIWKEEKNDSVSGTVIYDYNDPEEIQDFIWYMKEEDIPSQDLLILINYLHENELLDIDQLKKPSRKIRPPMFSRKRTKELFSKLFNFRVEMVDDGIEGTDGDFYFIHE